MIFAAAINTISWVPPVQQFIAEYIIKQFPGFPSNINWLAVVSTIVFLVFVISTLWDLSKNVEEAENKKPSIKVVALSSNNESFLEVTNNGEKGVFKAQIALLHSKFSTMGYLYNGVWSSTNTNTSEIMKGQSDTIWISTVKFTKEDALFELHAFDTTKNLKYEMRSVRYNDLGKLNPKSEIEVNISSEPSLRKGVSITEGSFIRRYDVNLSGILPSKNQTRLTILPMKSSIGNIYVDN
ncbi:MAG: hypothetical protein NT082_00735 [Chloroflexi bacterium]|nr:hypothetical protein [Chloroflexota bacterium]